MYAFLTGIIRSINSVVNNYGVAIILFTFLIRIILFPLNLKSRVGMRKMTDLNPKLQALQKKYANDKDKLNIKTQELYKKEGVNPLAGCLPMLLSFPILIIMFNAMRQVANLELLNQTFAFITGEVVPHEGFLWIKNLWMPDSPFYPTAPTADILRSISVSEWQTAFNALSQSGRDAVMAAIPTLEFSNAQTIVSTITEALANNTSYVASTAILPGWSNINLMITKLSVFTHFNGLLILPILAAATQFLSTKFMPQQPTADGAQTGAFMKWFFPLFSAWICISYNASFALYWVAANVFSTVENVVMNKYLEKKDAEKAATIVEE
ncbi:MAG: YidC/Oxa1 family membrane protein insertase [Eubacteriales bacterium]|nr:YidC/Oxa1 family membrane protein insertase [Eubacteriales bacterium]